MESKSQRRIQVIQKHFLHQSDTSSSVLRPHQTAGEYHLEQGYSVVLPEKLQTGKWNVYRSAFSPLKLVSRYQDHPAIATLHDNFVHAAETYGDYKYLGTRVGVDGTVGEYKWMTYREAAAGSCVGLYFNNRPEWLIVDHACSAYSYISVPLYDTLGPECRVKLHRLIMPAAGTPSCTFWLPKTTKKNMAHHLLSYLSEVPSVRLIVVIGASDDQLASFALQTNVDIITYTRLQSQGQEYPKPFCPPKPEDIATICYTSGTTGKPKGAVVSHGNLIANNAGQAMRLKFYPSDIYISYLPLAHIYERSTQVMLAYFGVGIGFYQGDSMKLMDDMVSLRPTVFFGVPRVFNRLYAGITSAVQSSGVLRKRLFNAAYAAKRQAILDATYTIAASSTTCTKIYFLNLYVIIKEYNDEFEFTLAQAINLQCGTLLVFNKIQANDLVADEVLRFIMSEAFSHLSTMFLEFLSSCRCLGCVFLEAYGMTENSCAISNMDLGDNLCGHVATALNSDSLKSSLVAVVSLDEDAFKAWAAAEGIECKDFRQLCNDPRARAAVLADMTQVAKKAQLRGFECVKAVTLVVEPFTMENGLLTPTFKACILTLISNVFLYL
ncbi:long chain acyl-CoA synthetase 6, peroxisomal-like protein [Tanacetum coccineum]|uniref:Long chain acyl-CoA synthetase 6, peroxisomal-like protein n=1 Tax=Tanacetum coccineum TaxID=301880 RepID=A0ABQ5G5K9_9ASTR